MRKRTSTVELVCTTVAVTKKFWDAHTFQPKTRPRCIPRRRHMQPVGPCDYLEYDGNNDGFVGWRFVELLGVWPGATSLIDCRKRIPAVETFRFGHKKPHVEGLLLFQGQRSAIIKLEVKQSPSIERTAPIRHAIRRHEVVGAVVKLNVAHPGSPQSGAAS